MPMRIGVFFLLLALIVRFWWMVHSGDWVNPLQHWMMEEVAIAQHIAAGRGFLCPYVEYDANKPPVVSTFFAPAYPYMLAGLLRLFGNNSELSAYRVSMVINGLIGAGAIGLLAGLAFARFGLVAGFFTGLLGSVLPPLVYRSATLWDSPFVMICVAAVLFITGSSGIVQISLGKTVAWGAVLGLASLFNPVVLPLIFATAVIIGFKGTTRMMGVWRTAIFCLVCAIVLLPWTLRNYKLCGHIIPIRNAMGIQLMSGLQSYCDGTTDTSTFFNESSEGNRLLEELGEDVYFRQKKIEALHLIKRDFSGFLLKSLHRVSLFWIGNLDKNPFSVSKSKILAVIKAGTLAFLLMLTLIGIRSDPDKYMQWLALFSLFTLPLPYYITLVCPQYRIPVLLIEVYWGGAGLQFLVQAIKQRIEMKMIC